LWWAISDGDKERIDRCEQAYFVVVEEWNASFWRNRNKIRLLVGDDKQIPS
jgi:hypothetical protein